MCRNIRTLFNFEPPVTDAEIEAAALQFVRKVSGFHTPSRSNAPAFHQAVATIAAASRALLDSLETQAPPKDRATEAAKAKQRAAGRYKNHAGPESSPLPSRSGTFLSPPSTNPAA